MRHVGSSASLAIVLATQSQKSEQNQACRWSFQQHTALLAAPSWLNKWMCVTGTLPQSWGGNESFSALTSLQIGCGSSTSPQGLTGSLPSEWGSSGTFHLLQTLVIDTCSITGEHGFLGRVDTPPDWQCFLTWAPPAQQWGMLGLHATSTLASTMTCPNMLNTFEQ